MKTTNLLCLATFLVAGSVYGQQVSRRAMIQGNAVNGKCTIEVEVDGAAQVEVQGDMGQMRNLSGQRAIWRRFECNGRLPANPVDFRFRGIDGRGDVQLLQDPRQNGGRIVFRIDDPQGGREGYTVDLEWRGDASGGQWSGDSRGWRGPGYGNNDQQRYGNNDQQRYGNNDQQRYGDNDRQRYGNNDRLGGAAVNRDPRYYDNQGRWNTSGTARAAEICQLAATNRLQQDGFRNISIQRLVPDNNPGRNDFVFGQATARQGRFRRAYFNVTCAVNLANGNVRSVEVVRR